MDTGTEPNCPIPIHVLTIKLSQYHESSQEPALFYEGGEKASKYKPDPEVINPKS